MQIPETKVPEPPRHLSPVAKKEFRRVAAILIQRGQFDPIRRTALEAYAASFARCREAEKRLLVAMDQAERKDAREQLTASLRRMRAAGRDLALWGQDQTGQQPDGQEKAADNVDTRLDTLVSDLERKLRR